MTAVIDTAEALRAAHALTTGLIYSPDDGPLIEGLMRDAYRAGDGFEIALGVAHSSLRIALTLAESRTPGFTANFLTEIGASLADDAGP